MKFLNDTELKESFNSISTYEIEKELNYIQDLMSKAYDLAHSLWSKRDDLREVYNNKLRDKEHIKFILDNYELYSSKDFQEFYYFASWLDDYFENYDYRYNLSSFEIYVIYLKKYLNGIKMRDFVSSDDEFKKLYAEFKKYIKEKKK